jgi:hypothetical protein
MNNRPVRSAIALSFVAFLAFAGTVAADTARADGDVATAVVEPVANLLPFAPGEVRSVDIGIVLTCTGTSHVDPGQTVTAGIDSWTAPLDGMVVSVTDGTVGPAPTDWTPDGISCPLPARMFYTGTPSVVTLRAPTTPGTGYTYSLMYHRSIEPFGANDPAAIRQLTAIDIVLDVVGNTPPTLTLPTVASGGSVEANTTGGWIADWAGLVATDAQDTPDPTPSCSPAAGTPLPLGTTSVACSVTDNGGMSASGSFAVTVVDTTGPTLTGLPASQNVTTNDPAGTTLTYSAPSATDVADAAPTVACLPASGSHIGPGTTIVTCTATDASGNSAQGWFSADVFVNLPPTLTLPTLADVGTVEGNRIGGWGGPWLGLGATDVEDDPDPTAACEPVPDTVLALGTTTVTCSVTDNGGLTTTAAFSLTVVDTTPPAMLSFPEDVSLTTGDPTGITVGYWTPSAMDVVDSNPAVACLPLSGSNFDVGTTPVTCTATDASGNPVSQSFNVTVVYVAPHSASATWGEPIDGDGSTFVANRGRNIKVKVQLAVDGVDWTTGDALLTVTPCTGGSPVVIALTYGGGRWNAWLDTSVFVEPCHAVVASIDGLAAGSFQLDLRGAEPVKKPAATARPAPVDKPAPAPTAKPAPAPTNEPAPAPTAKPDKTDKPAPPDKPAKTNNGKK